LVDACRCVGVLYKRVKWPNAPTPMDGFRSMLSAPDIWRAAQLMVKGHGEDLVFSELMKDEAASMAAATDGSPSPRRQR